MEIENRVKASVWHIVKKSLNRLAGRVICGLSNIGMVPTRKNIVLIFSNMYL